MSKRIDTYKTLSPELQELYASEETAILYDQLEGRYGIKNKIAFIDSIGDTILGFYSVSELPTVLQTEVGLTQEQAQRIVSDLTEFLSPVLEREQQTTSGAPKSAPTPAAPANPRAVSETAMPDPAETEMTPSQTVVATEMELPTNNTESDVHEVVPMRTMQGDMNRIHGYGAYRDLQPASDTDEAPSIKSEQTDVLASRPLTDTPKVEG